MSVVVNKLLCANCRQLNTWPSAFSLLHVAPELIENTAGDPS